MYTINSDMIPSSFNGKRGEDQYTGKSVENVTLNVEDIIKQHKGDGPLTKISLKACVCKQGFRDSIVEEKTYFIGEDKINYV